MRSSLCFAIIAMPLCTSPLARSAPVELAPSQLAPARLDAVPAVPLPTQPKEPARQLQLAITPPRREESPIHKAWWLWSVAGVIVAVGVADAVVAATHQPASAYYPIPPGWPTFRPFK